MTLLAAVLASVLAAEPGGEGGALTRPPELLEFVPAEYPPDAAANAIEGSVTLEIVIDESGDVRQAVVVDAGPHPGFAPAALHAVQQFRFRPAEIDGAPAAVQIVYRYDFVLRHERQEAPVEAPLALEGRVIARDTRAPVGGARVSAGSVTVETGTDGRFTLRGVPPGEVVVVVTSPEHETLSVTESIAAGQVREVEYRIARRHTDPYQAVVRGERARREVTVRTLAAEEVRTIPGTQGDTLKVLQNLPGVARSPFGIGLLVVRGSEPSETPVYVDGVPIPQLYHFGGITSVVNADVVDSIEFFPGNFSTRFGRALGGTVDLRTRNGRRQWHGTAQLDVLDGRVEMDGPVGKGSAFAAVRRSWIDAVLAVALPRVDREASNDLRVAPRYWDWQAKLTYPVLGGRGTLFAYGSDDRLELLRASDQPGRPTFHLATQFWRVGVSHRLPLGAATNDVVLAVGRDFFDVLTGGDFGLLTDVLALSLRDALTVRISPALVLEIGVDGLVRRIGYETYAPPTPSPGSVGDPFVDSPSTLSEGARGWWLAPGAWFEADWRATPRLRVVAGVRADAESRFGRAKLWIDPRLSTFVEAGPSTTVVAAAGLFGSAPEAQATSRTFGNPDLDPERGLHLSLGARQRLPWETRLDVTGFYKELWSLVVPTRAVGADGRLLRLSNEGRGRTIGLELLLKREFARGLQGWLAWTVSRSLRQDDPSDPNYPSWRPFLLDQTHVLALVLSYRLRNDWTLGTRVRAVTGNPITPATGAVLDADNGRYQCVSGAPLSRRLPGFFQTDARLDKRFTFESWMMSVYLDVQNVTNRQNAEFRFHSYDCASDVPLPSLPVLPAFGLRAEW